MFMKGIKNMNEFSTIVCERLIYYVYIIKCQNDYTSSKLGNVLNNSIIYIGKGKNNRAFSHRNEQWFKDGNCIEEFVAIQLTEETALHVESSMISLIGLDKLENKTSSKGSQTRRSIEDIKFQLDIDPLVLDSKDVGSTLLVIFEPKKTRNVQSDYESATKWWKVNKNKAKNIKTILRMNKVTRKIDAVVENISSYSDDPNNLKRTGFDNDSRAVSLDSKYIGKWADHIRCTSANPIQYL